MSSSGSVSSSGTISNAGRMSSVRAWLFGILTLAGAGAWLYAWLQPWWTAYIVALDEIGVTISPFAMRFGATLRSYPQWLVGAEMPRWFFPMMWVYLGVCLGAVVFSLFTTEEDKIALGKMRISLPKALVAGVGIAFIVFVVVFAITVAVRAPSFYGASLQGSVFIHMQGHEGNAESYVDTALQPGYWIACASGLFLLILGLLRDKITGKS